MTVLKRLFFFYFWKTKSSFSIYIFLNIFGYRSVYKKNYGFGKYSQVMFLYNFLYNFPLAPYNFNLNISPLCQTLSKALGISKKTPLTSIAGLQSKKIINFISCTIDNNWEIQGSPCKKPDWEFVKALHQKWSFLHGKLHFLCSEVYLQ